MLFNSLVFLLLFLPGALLVHGAIERWRPAWRTRSLVALSLVFYGTWDLRLVPLLVASIVLNWLAALAFARTARAALLAGAITGNLLLLGLFKYLGFFAGLVDAIGGLGLKAPDLALPIGISFFTFQHISYLSDLKAGRASLVPPLRYALYIAFFPRVVAGPLVRPAEFFPQLDVPPPADRSERLARGLLLLLAGLAKKVFLGDPLAELVDPAYATIAGGGLPGMAEAWLAALGYTFQLYFDFAGYTDMALGIALTLGVTLPENFRAPYRATSIQDFWRRWHITLSTFLRDYLYISFGGNRHGLPRQLLALFATMALGGLWHGAGWTFVAWGAAHGLALGADLCWRKSERRMPAALGWFLTFAFVMLAWVLFRAPSFEAALAIYRGLLGLTHSGNASEGWRLLAVAAAFATLGPTAFDLTRRVPPRVWVAVGAAVLAVAVILQVGDDTNRVFIYAKF